jgi:nucleotide-binding universal stress UspA family protein
MQGPGWLLWIRVRRLHCPSSVFTDTDHRPWHEAPIRHRTAVEISNVRRRPVTPTLTSGLYHTHNVHVLTIHDDTTAGEEVAQRAVDYLRAHEMAVERQVEEPQEDIRQQILDWVRRTESGLLIMGAHGHSRLRKVLLGSTTHTILDASEVPVMLEHEVRRAAARSVM